MERPGEAHIQALWTLHAVIAMIAILFVIISEALTDIPFPALFIIGVLGVPALLLNGFAAYGLYQRTDWGRIVSLVACILAVFQFPFGTAFAIYGLWIHVKFRASMQPAETPT